MLLALAGTAQAQKGQERNKERSRSGLFARIIELLPQDFADELNLDAQQRKKIQELEEEFDQRRTQALIKSAMQVAGIINGLQKEDNREAAPILAIAHEVTGGLLDERRLRVEYEKKMLALFNDEQREKYAELKERGPEERRERRLARQEDRGTSREAGPWQLLSPEVQRQLHLRPEQKQKLAELRREMERQLRDVLTEDQQKKFDELKASGRTKKGSAREDQ
jgi:Spy/CpxP family protein refolding chaperone